jgi:CRISPR system Cascade subunit CasD
MAVREEHPGTILVDYQTITGGYITAKRTFSKKGIELTKEYLQEASFLVLLEGKRHILEVIHEGFKNPQWPIYLGRKCCIPARPIKPKIKEYGSLMEALETIQWDSAYSNRKSETLRCIIEDPMGSMTRSDEIVASPARIFRKRRVSEIWVSSPEGTS